MGPSLLTLAQGTPRKWKSRAFCILVVDSPSSASRAATLQRGLSCRWASLQQLKTVGPRCLSAFLRSWAVMATWNSGVLQRVRP